jgi:RND family efflux transporter MFP subunit
MVRNKTVMAVVVVVACAAGLWYFFAKGDTAAGAPAAGGRPGAGMGAGFRPTMTVELGTVTRGRVSENVTVVGSLIGAATVDVVPKVSGRLDSVAVKLGDRVQKGQLLGKLEDNEIQEQARQTDASFEVARATVRQREADLKFAEITLDRTKNLFARNLVSRQALEDSQARTEASQAQVDLAKAQFAQAQARREEVRINLANTRIVSPVNGFVASRRLDAGAYVSPNAPLVSVVDIQTVRIVANLVERDLTHVSTGMDAAVNVDAFPGEVFKGRVARIAPILDPATRTAQMEVEIPNADFRLKPGMYARVEFTVRQHDDALIVPRNAIVDLEGTRGVFVAENKVARFRPVQMGIVQGDKTEILTGVAEHDAVVTTGAGALRDGDPIQLVSQGGRQGAPGAPANRGAQSGQPGGRGR